MVLSEQNRRSYRHFAHFFLEIKFLNYSNKFRYKIEFQFRIRMCGVQHFLKQQHDKHMEILIGIGRWLSQSRIKTKYN